MNRKTSEGSRKRLRLTLPATENIDTLLTLGPAQMTLRESALYIAGYVAGFDDAQDEE